MITFLANHFEVSQREVIDYFEIMSKKDIEHICKEYGKNKKQIKELMK